MILITIQFGELLLLISLRIINALRSYIKHSPRFFNPISNTRLVFSTQLSVFGYLMKHSVSESDGEGRERLFQYYLLETLQQFATIV